MNIDYMVQSTIAYVSIDTWFKVYWIIWVLINDTNCIAYLSIDIWCKVQWLMWKLIPGGKYMAYVSIDTCYKLYDLCKYW